MNKVPSLGYRKIVSALQRDGWIVVRQKGSHVFYRHPDGRTTTLPNHGGRDISRPLVREILREISVTTEEFVKLLNEI